MYGDVREEEQIGDILYLFSEEWFVENEGGGREIEICILENLLNNINNLIRIFFLVKSLMRFYLQIININFVVVFGGCLGIICVISFFFFLVELGQFF